MPRAVDLRLVAERLIGCRNAGVLLKLVVLLVARPLGDGLWGRPLSPFRIQNLEPTAGFEPATRCLQNSCSAS